MKTVQMEISSMIAREKDIPTSFVAKVLVETPKAVYVYGHGEVSPHGTCARCGRELTHPGSILIGIGPECLGNWDMRDIVLDRMTQQDIDQALGHLRNRIVDTWIPKVTIKEWEEVECDIEVPIDHLMLKPLKDKQQRKQASLIRYADTGKPAIKILFPFNKDTLECVKSLPGRYFHGAENPKFWTCPCTVEAIQALIAWKFDVDAGLLSFLKEKEAQRTRKVDITEIPGLKRPLYPFQREDVAFIEKRNGRVILGSEMGLGKTIQVLAWLQLHPENRPAVIVVPATLKYNWEREAVAWMEAPNTQILSGTKSTTPIVGDIIIVNYDILSAWLGVLQRIRPKVLVTDEAHNYKNEKAKRTKAVMALAKGIPYILPLSGTPIVNRPVELYNALKLVDDEGVFSSFWKFAMRYCGAKHNGFGWDFSGASHTDELHEKLKSLMIRRLKKDVLTDLPDKTRSFLPLKLANSKEYRKAEKDFIQWVKENKGPEYIAASIYFSQSPVPNTLWNEAAARVKSAEALAKIETLKQLAVKGKLEQAIEWIRDFLEVDGKLVVFTTHIFTVDALMKEFGNKAVRLDGSVTGLDRETAVQRFQNDDTCRLFVGNIKAAGVGITLTAASNVAILELPWTPGELVQAEDRCHRIGQKNAVNVNYLLASGTIEERIARMLDSKRQILDAVLDGKETESENLLAELMKEYEEATNE